MIQYIRTLKTFAAFAIGTILLCITQFNTNAQWTDLPPNIFADTLAYPFYYGVASGDPLSDKVILWTKVEVEDNQTEPVEVTWQIANDEDMSDIVNSGAFTTDASRDWTVKVDADSLEPHTTYYYQFQDADGNASQIGRTKTAPSIEEDACDGENAAESLKFAFSSCSSVYSGYFNAYKRIAERTDLDAVIHLGDYVYDYPDQDELVRIPEPYPIDPRLLPEWRQTHRYYLLDTDLRAMRQMHPMIVIWDNHDIDTDTPEEFNGAVQAFYEYLPIRQAQETPDKIYRHLQYGNLVDIFMVDAEQYQGDDIISIDTIYEMNSDVIDTIITNESILGTEQYNWLIDKLENSTAKWRIFGNQKLFGLWSIKDAPIDLPIGNGEVIDPGSWDGYQKERENLLTYLQENELDNNIFLSGDVHFFLAMDVPIHPLDSLQYNGETGEGSIGVEMMGGSITRGNFDEAGYPIGLADGLVNLSFTLNPHHRYAELVEHGYGLLEINIDSMIGQTWYSRKDSIVMEETLGFEGIVRSGCNRWDTGVGLVCAINDTINIMPCDTMSNDTMVIDTTGVGWEVLNNQVQISEVYPNPTRDNINLNIAVLEEEDIVLEIIEASTGKLLKTYNQKLQLGDNPISLQLDFLNSGLYLLNIKGDSFYAVRKFVKGQ